LQEMEFASRKKIIRSPTEIICSACSFLSYWAGCSVVPPRRGAAPDRHRDHFPPATPAANRPPSRRASTVHHLRFHPPRLHDAPDADAAVLSCGRAIRRTSRARRRRLARRTTEVIGFPHATPRRGAEQRYRCLVRSRRRLRQRWGSRVLSFESRLRCAC